MTVAPMTRRREECVEIKPVYEDTGGREVYPRSFQEGMARAAQRAVRSPGFSGLLLGLLCTSAVAARCCVKDRFETLAYSRVRSAFQSIFAWHRIHLGACAEPPQSNGYD